MALFFLLEQCRVSNTFQVENDWPGPKKKPTEAAARSFSSHYQWSRFDWDRKASIKETQLNPDTATRHPSPQSHGAHALFPRVRISRSAALADPNPIAINNSPSCAHQRRHRHRRRRPRGWESNVATTSRAAANSFLIPNGRTPWRTNRGYLSENRDVLLLFSMSSKIDYSRNPWKITDFTGFCKV